MFSPISVAPTPSKHELTASSCISVIEPSRKLSLTWSNIHWLVTRAHVARCHTRGVTVI